MTGFLQHKYFKLSVLNRSMIHSFLLVSNIYIYVNLSIHSLLMDIGVISSFCCCSVAKSCPTVCDSMDCSMLGCTILPYFPDFAQTYAHGVDDAI